MEHRSSGDNCGVVIVQQASEALVSEKVKTVGSLQSQVSRLEDSSQEVQTQLSNLTLRLRDEQQRVKASQEETQLLRSKLTGLLVTNS